MATKSKCPRSLTQVLIAAASTAAFIAAANFGFAPNISSKAGLWARWFQCLKMELGEPFRAFAHSLVSAAILWRTLRSEIYKPNEEAAAAVGCLQKIGEKLKKTVQRTGLVAIMLNCPILIRIPPKYIEDYVKYNIEDNKKKEKVQISEPEWMTGLKILKDIHSWNPLELPAGADDHIDVDQSPQASRHPPLYIKLHPSHWRPEGTGERTLLLQWNLVPQYEQLRYLRARSTFEAVVTTVQSLGYMLGVSQRIVKRNAVSPLEAIMAFFNLLIVLQFIMNLYACVHYQRPLCLRLSLQQFHVYADAHTNRTSTNTAPSLSKTSKVFLVVGSLISVALYAVIQFAFIRYAISNYNLRHCILCSLSAFLVNLLALSALILIGLFVIPGFRESWKSLNKKLGVEYTLRIGISIISTTSTILALVATIIHWDHFRGPTTNWLQWAAIPYVNN